MRLLITADLHYNHAKSRPSAEDVAARMNRAGGDAVLLVGDAASGDGEDLERCLDLFDLSGPKLFVAGNHDLWTRRGDSRALFEEELPRRVRGAGWRWLEGEPFVAGRSAVVGSVGWYDYSFANESLGIPRDFYAAKTSPGAVAMTGEPAELVDQVSELPEAARDVVARWNDGKFVSLGVDDVTFLEKCISRLEKDLGAVASAETVVAAVHHVPLVELLPSHTMPQAAAGRRGRGIRFARAYLGSGRLGEAVLRFPNVRHLVCGHSHVAAQAVVQGAGGPVAAVNVGGGYRDKRFIALDLPD